MRSYNQCKPGSCLDVIAEVWKNLAVSPGDITGHLQLLTFQNRLRKEYEPRFSSESFLLRSSNKVSIHCGMSISSLEKSLRGDSRTLKKKKAVSPGVPGSTGDEAAWIENFELKSD